MAAFLVAQALVPYPVVKWNVFCK